MNMRRTLFSSVALSFCFITLFSVLADDQPGWFAYKGERQQYGEDRWSGSAAQMGQMGLQSLPAVSPDYLYAEIEELARNLHHDPKLIFEFVHNKIDYIPYYGFMKGARQTLAERAGNDADIAALLVALLRASGFDAEYVYGAQQIPTVGASSYTAARWLDVDDVPAAVDTVLINNGIPGIATATWTWVDRIWVASFIDGAMRQLDAGFKPRVRGATLDWAAAMGYNRSSLLSDAGGVVTTNHVQSLNETNIVNRLTAWSTALVETLRTEHSDADLDDLLGRSRIVELEFAELPTSLLFPAYVEGGGETAPSHLMHHVRIQHGAIDLTLSFAQIAGRRVAVTYTEEAQMPMKAQAPEGLGFALQSAIIVGAASAPTLLPVEGTPVFLEPSKERVDAIQLDPALFVVPDPSSEVELSGQAAAEGGQAMALLNGYQDLGAYRQGETPTWVLLPSGTWCHGGSAGLYSNRMYFTENTHNVWSLSPLSFSLSPQQCNPQVTLTLNVGNVSRGWKQATIQHSYKWLPCCAAGTQLYAQVSAWVSEIPNLAGSGGVNFGQQYYNQPVTSTALLRNSGSQTLQITSMSLVYADSARFQFMGGNGAGSVGAGQTRYISVRYNADQLGSHSNAAIRVNFTYDSFSYQTDIPLSGSTHREPNVAPSYGINFQTHYYQNPVTGTGVLHNAGSQALQITSVSLEGADASRYEPVSGFGAGSVGAGQIRNIAVRCKADAAGLHTNASIRVVFNYDGINGYQVALPLAARTISAPKARLWLDDELIAEETGLISESVSSMTLSFMHPSFTNSTYPATFPLKRGAAYAVIADFGDGQEGNHLNARQRQLDRYRRAGVADDSREVLTETLNILGHTWMRQTALADDLLDPITKTRRTWHHRFGIMAQEEGYYVDIKAQLFTPIARDGNEENASVRFRAGGLIASALEHGMLEQMQGTNNPAASTVKLLQRANAAGQKVFLAASNNYAYVRSQLSNYSTNDLAVFQQRVNAGQTLVLPQNAQITLNDWKGTGYIVSGPGANGLNEIGMIIAGNYYGGYAGYPDFVNVPYVVGNNDWVYVRSVETPREPVLDPVDIATGQMLYDRTDLMLGEGVPPMGVALKRTYDSGQNTLRSPLGYGWRHSLNLRAQMRSEGASGLGRRTPADAAALMVATVAIEDVIRHEPTAKGWLTATLVAKWAADQLTGNAVSIQAGDANIEFIRQPDGSYTPPPGHTAELEKIGNQYLLKQRYGTEWLFGSNGRLSTWTDADGNVMAFTYNARTNVQTVTDSHGRTLTFSYGGSGSNLVSVSDGTGRSVGYTVTGGNLVAAADPEGKTWSFTYDNQHRLLTQTDPLGRMILSNTYSEASGIVLSQMDANGALWNMYTVPQYRGVEENPMGEQTVYWFDAKSRRMALTDAEGHTSYTAYDGQDRVILEADPLFNITRYSYDADHNLTNQIDALGHETAFTYDAQHRLIAVRDPLGNETHTEYNAQHHPVKITDALNNQTQIAYTQEGLPETITGPRGESAVYTYDAFGNPQTITHSDGGSETRVYSARGDLLSATDANSNTTTYTWDKRRLQTSTRDALGGLVSNTYNGVGLLVSVVDPRGGVRTQTWTPRYEIETVHHPDGGMVSNQYDTADRLIATWDPLGNTSSNVYDAAGRRTHAINPLGHTTVYQYDPAGNVVSIQDAVGGTISNIYDALHRVVVAVDPLGHGVTNEYDAAGRLVAVSDAMGRRTDYEYDPLGRLVKQTRGNIQHEFEYDASGNRTAYVNPKGARMGFGFDLMNRAVAETNAIGNVIRLAYDPVGNLIQKTQPDTRAITYHYDALNRLVQRQSASFNDQYAYDASGNLTNVIDGLGNTRQTFDERNRLLNVTDPFGQTVSNTYNLAGQRIRLAYPEGEIQTFGYDPAYRLTNTTAAALGVASVTYTFDEVASLIGIARPGGSSSFTRDPLRRIIGYSANNGTTNFIQRTLTRNALGFKTQEQIEAGLEVLTRSSSQAYFHNVADQVMDVYHTQPGMTVVPWYDANGNVTQVVQTLQIEAGPPLVFTSTYEYDADNRLIAVESPLLTAQYAYDGLGNLLQINETGTIRRLVRDRADELARPLVLTDASGAAVQTYVWANGSLIAQVETGAVRYAHFNELGHLLALTDESGDVTDEFAYHPYGRLVAHVGITETPFAYMGAYGVMRVGYDLYLTRHRAYSANLMRWLSVDPIGLDGGWNLYAYAGGNPVSLIDVLGLSSEGPRAWVTQAPVQSSVYSGAILRDLTQSAAPYYTDALLLGSSIRPTTPAGQAMAFSQAAGYLTAPGGEMLAGAIGSAASRIISKAVTPVARSGGPAAKSIATPQGPAIQSMTAEAQAALRQAQSGAPVYRAGGLGTQRAAEGQYWSFQNPASTPGYANRMGMPGTGAGEPFIMGGRVNPSSPFITREAPGIGNNLGGSVEAVTQPGGVTIDWFHMP